MILDEEILYLWPTKPNDMMKSYLLIPIFLVFSLFASSQSIINFTHFSYLQNKNVIGYITGYDTHFAQADSNKVSFESATDTLSFWVKSSSTDNNLSFSSTKHFDSDCFLFHEQ